MHQNTSNPDSTPEPEPRRLEDGISRRHAIRTMALGALAARVLKADGAKAQERPRPVRSPKPKRTAVETPQLDFGVCYGAKVDDSLIPKFKEIIMEPGHYIIERTGELANVANVGHKSSAIPIAYVPLMALNRSNRAHHYTMNTIDKANGWLRDAEGNVMIQSKSAPNDTYMLDLRKEKTKQAMTHYVSSMVKAGYGGVFVDMMDDVAALETSDPKTYAGSRAAAVEFVQEIFGELERAQELRAKRNCLPLRLSSAAFPEKTQISGEATLWMNWLPTPTSPAFRRLPTRVNSEA